MRKKPSPQQLDSGADDTTDAQALSNSGGQSGDTQGLFDTEDTDSESVKELLEDGQYFEAAAISGVGGAPRPDVAEVTTRQFAEDDVPEEYLDEDEPPRWTFKDRPTVLSFIPLS
jgi:hypothetical protein